MEGLIRPRWEQEDRKILVCVDSYNNGVLCGRYFNTNYGMERFDSLSQLLIRIEERLDENQAPQACTMTRSFTPVQKTVSEAMKPQRLQGEMATFELKILFRQHTSWQGVVEWLEKKSEQKFRSVLELVMLMDSALKDNG